MAAVLRRGESSFVWAVIQGSNTNPAQLINTGSRERRGRNNDAVKSGFMNMEQCLILHYYGCYLKHTPSFFAGDCYFLSSVWMEPVIVLIEALKDFSWNEMKNTKGRILDEFLEEAVVRNKIKPKKQVPGHSKERWCRHFESVSTHLNVKENCSDCDGPQVYRKAN